MGLTTKKSETLHCLIIATPPMSSLALFVGAWVLPHIVHGAKPFDHSWDTVADIMAMHGKYGVRSTSLPTDKDIEFVAKNYAVVTTGTGCDTESVNKTFTIEDSVLQMAARIKAVNPSVKVGMYWRSDFALEIADCSDFSDEWNSHPEWRLKNDQGKVIDKGGGKYYIDYSNPAAAAFFAKVLVNVTKAKLPSGEPILDYVYIDGDPSESTETSFKPGVGPERSAKLVDDVYNTFGNIQSQLDAQGFDQKVQLNAMDDLWGVQHHVATGAAANMFDHWSILQFLNKTDGSFNATLMDGAFQLATNPLLNNVSTFIKGWPGPIIHQRDEYPPNIPQPKEPKDFQKVAAERFNNELALFLLVAEKYDFWIYSWFWGFYDYVGGNDESTTPADFFPQAKCPLGEPAGPYERVKDTWTYKRQFKYADVFVDLTNRTACRVEFTKCEV